MNFKTLVSFIIINCIILVSVLPGYSSAYAENVNEVGEQPEYITDEEVENEYYIDDEIDEEIIEELGLEINEEIDLEVIEASDELVEIETTLENDDLNVQVSTEIDIESGDVFITSETVDEEGNVTLNEFELYIAEVEDDIFKAELVDTETGEIYVIDTTEVSASAVPLVIIAIHVARFGVQYAIKKYGKSVVTNATKKYGSKATTKALNNLKFANKSRLTDHFGRHKKEFGNISQNTYLKRAQSLAGTTGKHVLSKKKSNGDIYKYNTKTNELLVMTKNDVIKTFFKPKHPNAAAGRAYYNRQ